MSALDATPFRETVRRGQRRQEVVERIKDYILRNHLRPGDPLPTESELCEAIGASRSSVREAVKTLSALDIVTVRHGHGTFVGTLSLAALVESLAFRGLLGSAEDQRVLGQVVDVRQTLEQGLSAQIIAGLDDDDRDQLSALAAEMGARARRGEDFLEVDREFHLKLMEPLGNDLVLQLTEAFWQVQAIVAPTLRTEPDERLLTAERHAAILDAAAAGDEAAFRDAIAAHYAPVRASLARAVSH